jgi:hypothetical protein
MSRCDLDEASCSRSGGDQANARTSSQAPDCGCHKGRILPVTAKYELWTLVIEHIEHGHNFPTGNSENELHLLLIEASN